MSIFEGIWGARGSRGRTTALFSIPGKRDKLKLDLFHGYDVYTQGELYKPNASPVTVIGIKSPTLTDFCYAAGPPVTKENDLTATVFDYTTRGDSARILLTNSTGATRYLTNVTIRGSLVKAFSNVEGFIHDAFIDYESIRRDGERKLEIGNNFICLKSQVEKIADFHNKFNKGKKHLYTLTDVGVRHYYEVGEWYTLQINDAFLGIDEYMDMKCRCVGVSIERGPDELGTTEVILEEVEESWTFDANSPARFIIGGNISRLPTKEKIVVAASDYDGIGDYYCDGTSDEDQINAAIIQVAGKGGGIVELSEGNFYIDGSIDLMDNIVLQGRGNNTVIEKNCNDNGIYINAKTNVMILKLKLTTNASDTNNIAALYAVDSEDLIITECTFDANYSLDISNYAAGAIIVNNVFSNLVYASGNNVDLVASAHLESNVFRDNGGQYVVHLPTAGASQSIVANNIIYDNSGIGIYIANVAVTSAKITNNYCYNNGADAGYENANGDHFTDAGTNTQIAANSWQGVQT